MNGSAETSTAARAPDMDGTRLLLVRHGETAWNAGQRLQGHTDIPLNERGLQQAARLAVALTGEPLDAVYASDLLRAHATARAVADVAGLPVQTDTGLRERCFGIFEGLTYAEIAQRWPDQSERWRRRDPDFGAEGGETLREFSERAVAAAARLAAKHPGQSILLVAHGGVLDVLYRAAVRAPLEAPRTWALGNATVNRLLHSPEGFALVGWNDAQHLDGL